MSVKRLNLKRRVDSDRLQEVAHRVDVAFQAFLALLGNGWVLSSCRCFKVVVRPYGHHQEGEVYLFVNDSPQLVYRPGDGLTIVFPLDEAESGDYVTTQLCYHQGGERDGKAQGWYLTWQSKEGAAPIGTELLLESLEAMED